MKHTLGVIVNDDGSIKSVEIDIFKCLCIKDNNDPYTQLSSSIPNCSFTKDATYYYGIEDNKLTNKYFVISTGNIHRNFTENEFNLHFIDSLKNRENKIESITE